MSVNSHIKLIIHGLCMNDKFTLLHGMEHRVVQKEELLYLECDRSDVMHGGSVEINKLHK